MRARGVLGCLVGGVAVVSGSVVWAGAGALDPGFGVGGVATTDVAGGNDAAHALAVAPGGAIVVAGEADGALAVVRYRPDGTPDSAFGTDGRVVLPSAGAARAVALEPDGRIVTAGDSAGGPAGFTVVRLAPDGALDASFGGGGVATLGVGGSGTDTALGIAREPGGRIVVVGQADGTNVGIARLGPDGLPDPTFGGGAGWVVTDLGGADAAADVAVQADGRLLVGGTDGGDFALLRYAADGSLDPTFGVGSGVVTTDFGGLADVAFGLALEPNGRIILTGRVGAPGATDVGLARYLADGSPDVLFGGTGRVVTDFDGEPDGGAEVAVQADGRIVVGGWSAGRTALVRYRPVGGYASIDGAFGTAGRVTQPSGPAADLALQPDGRLVVAGTAGGDFQVARYLGTGLDAFVCYAARPTRGADAFPGAAGVHLADRLGEATAALGRPGRLCAPADVDGESPTAPLHWEHLEGYRVRRATPFAPVAAERVDDRFGSRLVDVRRPSHVLVPTATSGLATPPAPPAPAVDHFQCYAVGPSGPSGTAAGAELGVEDPFGTLALDARRPHHLCVPVDLDGGTPGAADHADHLVCYGVRRARSSPRFVARTPVYARNRLGTETLDALRPTELCVPARANYAPCASAVVVPPGGGVFVGATAGPRALAGACGGRGAPEAVYRWTPASSGVATIETCGPGTDFDTVLHVRSGSCAAETEAACNDDACADATGAGLASRVTLPVVAGETYAIVVDGAGAARGGYRLTVTPP
jgi:uncharacterized delta-60 repeat protein